MGKQILIRIWLDDHLCCVIQGENLNNVENAYVK